MHFEKLVIEAGTDTYTVAFNRRLTIIAGIGPLEREGLTNELLGGLAGERAGVHLELSSDAGNRFAVFRPLGGEHRVIDIDNERDVTPAYSTARGEVDLLARAGMDRTTAKHALRLRAADLTSTSETDRLVQALARVDQGRLWELADKVRDRERRLDEERRRADQADEDSKTVTEIEDTHRHSEALQQHHERIRTTTLYASMLSILLAVPAGIILTPLAFVPFALLAIAAGWVSLRSFRTLEAAQAAEKEALAKVGASSYLTFHLQRTNSLLADDSGRHQLLQAAEEHRAALAQWELLAGSASVDWALEHRKAIREAAKDKARRVGVVAPTPADTGITVDEAAAQLRRKLDSVAKIGPGGESFPLILDEPFVEVSPRHKGSVLELVARASQRQQVIFLTEDPDIAAWGRVEALTDDVDIVAPATTRGGEPSSHPPKRSRHAAA